jgi:hypothetical protein
MTSKDEDLKLIREIVAHGGRKYTAGNIDRSKRRREDNLMPKMTWIVILILLWVLGIALVCDIIYGMIEASL